VSAWTLAFTLAAHLTTSSTAPVSSTGLADWLLGESRLILSRNFFNEADLFFHKGTAHKEAALRLPGPFHYWHTEITPEQTAHAEGAANAEVLPWLKLATQTDPHNVDAFLVAAFWANSGLQRPDLAGEILNEAQRLNPGDYRIALEKGRLAIITHQFQQAIPLLQTALTLFDHTPATPDRARELALNRAEIMTFLGFLHETTGARTDAIHCFKDVLAHFPDRPSIADRVTQLNSGAQPPDSAQIILERITRKTVYDTCDHSNEKDACQDHHDDPEPNAHDHSE
jgi:tetratricopeptide (TPR) repeat protein